MAGIATPSVVPWSLAGRLDGRAAVIAAGRQEEMRRRKDLVVSRDGDGGHVAYAAGLGRHLLVVRVHDEPLFVLLQADAVEFAHVVGKHGGLLEDLQVAHLVRATVTHNRSRKNFFFLSPDT